MIFGTTQKLKFQKLKHRLRLKFYEVVGLLEAVWLTTYANAPDGDIGRLTNEEIAAALEWSGNADELVQALIDARWLDEAPMPYRLLIHEWATYCSASHKGNYAKYGKQFAEQKLRREVPRERQSEAPSEHPRECPKECPPNLTKPNPTSPPPKPYAEPPPDDVDGGNGFAEGWGAAKARMAELGVTRWKETIDDAKANGCTPGHVMELLAYAKSKGQPAGSIVWRVSRARMSLAVAEGWPPKPPDTAAAAKRRDDKAKKQAAESLATVMIKEGRRAKKPDNVIMAELTAAGLEWPR